jgi:hypothetical protein
MMNKILLGGLSAVLMINGALMLGVYMGKSLEISLGMTIFAGILAFVGSLGITVISVFSITGEEEALAKLQKMDVEVKTLKREQEIARSNNLKSERTAQDQDRKPHSPIRSHKPTNESRRFKGDAQILSA